MTSTNADCPCGSARRYPDCCGRWHAGRPAPDAEALMRSRYCAFVLRDAGYLRATWHPDTCPGDPLGEADGARPTWLGLQVKWHRGEGDGAEVEFVARYRVGGGRAVRLHERSRFVREDGRWFYVDGFMPRART